MKEIPLTQGFTAIVDDADYERVINFGRWTAEVCKKTVYARCHNQKYVTTRLHRFVMGVTDPKTDVDHWDHNGLNNQRANLRVCTRKQNAANMQKTGGTSKYKGVSWHADTGKWQAAIADKYIGLFASEEDAARAYDAKAREVFGEFAATNEMLQACTENG